MQPDLQGDIGRGSPRERHCVKFLAIRKPLKVAGLQASLKERTYPEEQWGWGCEEEKICLQDFLF